MYEAQMNDIWETYAPYLTKMNIENVCYCIYNRTLQQHRILPSAPGKYQIDVVIYVPSQQLLIGQTFWIKTE